MEFRTIFNIKPSTSRIKYDDPTMFIGSCFASSIGNQMAIGHMPVMINPAGTVYNPVSVSGTLKMIIGNKVFTTDDLYNNNGIYLSFFHNTEFSSRDPENVLKSINDNLRNAHKFLSSAKFLFITFGTARVYKLKKTGVIISNCHKLPPGFFIPDLLSVDEIVTIWSELLETLHTFYPALKVVFTISPVRHLKDGAHGNQVSKSILFISVEELLKHPTHPDYFPGYEILMDDLRDYRFYDDDMLHPSSSAINYIWDAFSGCYMDKKTKEIWGEVSKISRALNHRFNTGSSLERKQFAENLLKQISKIEARSAPLDLSAEKNYFLSLLL